MNDSTFLKDWTQGVARIGYQRCTACSNTWYFARGFCPRCGAEPASHVASGRGTVYAVTQVARAPTRELANHVPYSVLLVDAVEGFRLMAHGDAALRIGQSVQAEFRKFGSTLVPHFVAIAVAATTESQA